MRAVLRNLALGTLQNWIAILGSWSAALQTSIILALRISETHATGVNAVDMSIRKWGYSRA
jgi:hypothetical protein